MIIQQLCPVCKGRGFVPKGFYLKGETTSANNDGCRNCGGGGVVWVKQEGTYILELREIKEIK